MRDPAVGARIVPVVPDEGRSFGFEILYSEFGIYAPGGQHYTPVDAGLPLLEQMVHRVRKCRMLGSAALDMAYVACGRLDAYIEQGISLWDIAAGWLLVEAAGGRGARQ